MNKGRKAISYCLSKAWQNTFFFKKKKALTKHFLKNQLVDGRIHHILTACSPSLKKVRAGAQSMKYCNGHRETLLTACSARFLPGAPAQWWHHSQLLGFFSHQSSIKKMPCRRAPRPIWWGRFPNEVHSPKRSLACVNLMCS